MSRFAQTFNALYRKLPFSDEGRTVLRTWVEAIRREIVGDPGEPGLVNLQDEANKVYEAIWITDATGEDLDKWGEVLDIPRDPPSKNDPVYRLELLELLQGSNYALTLKMIEEGLEEIGSRFAPTLGVDAIHEHYKPYGDTPPGRRENGSDSTDDYSLGEIWGLCELDRLTFSVVVDRIPTIEEAFLLVGGDTTSPGLVDLKPAQSCGLIVNDLATTPPSYRLRSMAYSVGVAPWLWNDNFEWSDFDFAAGASPEHRARLYETFGDSTGTSAWVIIDYAGGEDVGDGRLELVGFASDGAVGVPHVCLPRTDVDPVVLEERDIYVDVNFFINDGSGLGYTDSAGLALRYDDSTGEMYALVFYGTDPYYYALYYVNDVGAWSQVIAPTATGIDMSTSQRVQCTLESNYLTLIINDTIKESRTDIGSALTSAGRWGFLTYGDACDLIVEEFKYW
ncbi:MAG: hypothetical protein PVH29_09990 [Candidatus Zixiibacteriota bacterium]|jgi:hypothetical protein